MAGFSLDRLVLIKATLRDAAGRDTFKIGTGYLVAPDLVLTAGHVVPSLGLQVLDMRTEQPAGWYALALVPVWRGGTDLDAVLLRVQNPNAAMLALAAVAWVEDDFGADTVWQSSGYPDAGKVGQAAEVAWKTTGLSGKVQAFGGGGQGQRELELTVEAAPPADQWAGISGAPVFVGDRIAGIVKEVPASFQGRRLAATPSVRLLSNHGFRLALSPPWLEPLPDVPWVLVVQSEAIRAQGDLGNWVDGALAKDAVDLRLVVGDTLQLKSVRVRVTDAVASPGRLLQFVNALCAAPIAIFDATGFEPAVMLALGMRAVVRRGVTLTSTAEVLTPARLSQLPFNIQETKLLHHGGGYAGNDVRHPLQAIPTSIKRGWQELSSQPSYLDLPAYDAVRCPYPGKDAQGRSALNRMLVLCSFGGEHEEAWKFLNSALLLRYPELEAARMLDIASPRLVGQALYEGIRWARTCLVDWSGWRPNVFFELGVRLACSEVGPVHVIQRSALDHAGTGAAMQQMAALIALFRPAPYNVVSDTADADDSAVNEALDDHEVTLRSGLPALAVDALPTSAVFLTCSDRFQWKQEHITVLPHDLLRSTIEAPLGKDPQAGGRSPLLFSTNDDYSRELGRSVKERWIAAWLYLSARYPRERWKTDTELRATLKKLGNDVLQFGLSPEPREPELMALRDDIFDALDEIDSFD